MSKKKIKMMLLGFMDRLEQINATLVEKNKYKDKRRIQIYRSVILSKKQIEEINSLYKSNYGRRVPTTWHRSYTAYTGSFDIFYFPETLYTPKFERYMNYDTDLANVLENKNLLYVFAEYANVEMPKNILTCQEGLYSTNHGEVINFSDAAACISNIGDCFAKPSVGTDSGRGCKVFCFKNGIDIRTGIPSEEVIRSLGKNFTIQERLICHESIRKLYGGSVNTFRIMTYRWHDEIIVAPIIMRIGRGGSYLDNAHAGGMFIAVSPDGTLHKRAFTEFEDSFTQHPDTKVRFEGYKVELLPKVVEAVRKLHYLLPTIGVINWDMTLNEKGDPVLIEANVNNGSIWLFQMAHGKGVFGEKTPEILRWIRKMDAANYSTRQEHHFGD